MVVVVDGDVVMVTQWWKLVVASYHGRWMELHVHELDRMYRQAPGILKASLEEVGEKRAAPW